MLKLELKVAKGKEEALTPLYKLVKRRGFKAEVKAKFHLLILHLVTLASADVSSKDLFRLLSRMKESLGVIAQVFRRLDLLVNKWGYNQVEACKMVAQVLPKCELKDFLLRLSQAIGVGLPVKDFAAVEHGKFLLIFQDEYERSMDRLRRICEAYSAILTASAFISVAMMLVAMIYGAGSPTSTLSMTALMIAITIVSMLYLMFRGSPKGKVVNLSEFSPRKLRQVERLAPSSMLLSSVVATTLSAFFILGLLEVPSALKANIFLSKALPIPLPLMITSAPLLVVGLRGRRLLEQVKSIDTYYPVFIKTLGDAAAVSGSVNEAVKAIVYNDYGPLTPLIKRLHRRLKMGVKTEVGWRLFEKESGSDLVNQSTEVFFNAVKNGGRAKESALTLFDFASLILTLRKKRSQVVGFLKGLVLPLQATLVSVLTLMKALMTIFSEYAKLVSSYVGFISYVEEDIMLFYLLFIILILTFGNAMAIHLVEGESSSSIAYYGGVLMLMAGLIVWLVDGAASSLFSMFSRFTTGGVSVVP